jgi:hypothetical protein
MDVFGSEKCAVNHTEMQFFDDGGVEIWTVKRSARSQVKLCTGGKKKPKVHARFTVSCLTFNILDPWACPHITHSSYSGNANGNYPAVEAYDFNNMVASLGGAKK